MVDITFAYVSRARIWFHLDTALARLCTASDGQQVLYAQQYIPMVNAGVQLGAILEGPNPQLADVKDASGLSPRERVVALRKDFLRFYETNALVLERGIREIHAALVPGALQTSVLAAYGQVLMTKRILNRVDSESLQGLYGDLAQTEALASWMAAEYRSASPQNPEAFRNVITAYLGNAKALYPIPPPQTPKPSATSSPPISATPRKSRRTCRA